MVRRLLLPLLMTSGALAASVPEDEWSELFSGDPIETGSHPIVSIEGLGAVRGRRAGRVNEYYAVKYANARRFEQGVPAPAWSGVRDATAIGPRCFQNGAGSDDCLHLDVRACTHVEGEALRPVMVWIHGGGYYTGSSTEDGFYNGTNIIEHSDCRIVYASIQYRLNTFGMLDHPSFGNSNFGFRDQQLALAWLQKHLHSFGGDKNRVIIAGESAGAGSVSLHLASPLSKGLFSAAIAESTYTPTTGAHLPRSVSQMYGTACVAEACPEAKTDGEVLSCLQEIDATALTDIGSCNTLMYSVDDWLFEEPVWKTAREGRLTAVPLVIGSQRDEWTFFQCIGFNNTADVLSELATLRGFNPHRLSETETTEVNALRDQLRQSYPTSEFPMVCGQAGGQDTGILTDMWIGCPTDQISRNHQAPTYRYLFSYNEYQLTNKYQFNQSYHTLELSYVFSNYSGKGFGASLGPIFEQEMNPTDLVLQNAFHDYWVSFVMNHQPSSVYSQWPLVSNNQMLEISANGQPTIRDTKHREAECEKIIRMYDSAFGVNLY